MTALTQGDIARMQDTQRSHMMDCCTILKFTPGAVNPRGYAYPSYIVVRERVSCGLQHSRVNSEAMLKAAEGTQVPMFDGTLRMPIDTQISALDRVKITHRFGVSVSDGELLEVVGTPRRGPSGLLASVKRVTVQ